jgi:hypothetical protein
VYMSTRTLPPPTHTPTPTWSPSRQGAVYTNTYTEPLEAGRHLLRRLHRAPRGRAPSTPTPTRSLLEAGRRLH